MTKDQAFDQCCFLLDQATACFQSRIKSTSAAGEKFYQEAIQIYEKYFAEIEKKVVDDFEF